jgi:predicted RNA methylase
VKRSDPVYNAHAYLTKVPVTAIEPFLTALTEPGDVVLDMYGGSGMTGVAAAILGRRAELRDISVLGRHIGTNYLNLVDGEALRAAAEEVVAKVRERLGDVYAARCGGCGCAATLSRTVWTFVYECPGCGCPVNYYKTFEAAEWQRAEMKCGSCSEPFVSRRSKRIAEEPVLDTIACECSSTLRDYEHSEPLHLCSPESLSFPDVEIGEHRQMFQASALKKHGLERTSAFFSPRNLAVLACLKEAIDEVESGELREKLMFSFTAILTRASKRYQWHPKRPLNAANQNYYIAPVFYEWNVFDLFRRKVEAALRSDRHIRERMAASDVSDLEGVRYEVGSADAIDLPDESADYVFTDPPFGGNIFYSDMNLFQEAWLGRRTDQAKEAVVDRSGKGKGRRTSERYERLIADSLKEGRRVLRGGGWLSMVFSNSNGEMWALLQRSIAKAGFELGAVTLLNKGQRSVKGLASGFENIVTMDLVLSMQKAGAARTALPREAPKGGLERAVAAILRKGSADTPSRVYLELIRHYFRWHWDMSSLDIGDVVALLRGSGYDVDGASGALVSEIFEAA